MAITKYFIQEGKIRSEIENFLKKELDSAGYSGMNIQKTLLSTRVTLYVEKPPLVIGKKGKRIDKLTQILKEKYNIENPSVDVQKVENPTLDPNIIARRIVSALEKGMNRRRVVYKAIRAIMNAGAQGVEIILAGKIIGKGGRARAEKYSEGYMKKAGDSTKLVRIGTKQAYLKAGVIGVTVKIVPPDVEFPDRFKVKEISKTEETKEKEQETKDVKAEESDEKPDEHKDKEVKKKKSKKEKEKKSENISDDNSKKEDT
ncbi:MAG: 30S ribosomal protein S3 [Candidatus Altiarchaeota archaeon]